MTDWGGYRRAEWRFRHCQILVRGFGTHRQRLTFFDVALTANKIIAECVNGVTNPVGGASAIGDPSTFFAVFVNGYKPLNSVTAENFNVSLQQQELSVSRRAIEPQNGSEDTRRLQGLDIRDPLRDVSRVSNHPTEASNSFLNIEAPPKYPVHCFDPSITPLPSAAAVDCSFLINQVILGPPDPTRQLTWAFTDAADINLSKSEYRKWQYGQCMISVRNNGDGRPDAFRLLDLAATARRITMQCVINTQHKSGGIASVGTDGRGFKVYLGGPLTSSQLLDDLMS